MSKQNTNVNAPADLINVTSTANSRRGDPLRTAFIKINDAFDRADANFTELYARAAADATDRIVSGEAELVITHDQYGGSVEFPAHSNGKIGIQSTEISAFPADLQNPNSIPLVLSSYNGEVWISPNATGPRPTWEFKQNGTINVPVPEGGEFTLTLSAANFVPREGKSTLTLSGAPWVIHGAILRNSDGSAQLQLDQIFPQVNNPGYVTGDTFTFDDQVHHLFEYNLEISLDDVVQAGPAGWTADVQASSLPAYPKSMTSTGALSLHGTASVILSNGSGVHEEQFKFIGRNLLIPGNGDIRRFDGTDYVSVLGGGGNSSVTTSDTAPSSPSEGDLWYDITSGRMYVYYDSTWVDSNPVDGSGNTFNQDLNTTDSPEFNNLDINGNMSLLADHKISFGIYGIVENSNYNLKLSSLNGINVVTDSSDGTYGWTFGGDGNTTFPNGIVFDGSEGNTFALDSGTISAINLRDDGGRGFYTDNGGYTVRGNGTYGWLFGSDGKLSFPDGHLKVEGSVISRRLETVNGSEIDAIGSKLTLTDNSIAMEAYTDPDGANNTMYSRVLVGTGTAIIKSAVEDVVGETAGTITVGGGGITINTDDGVLDSTWHFDLGGETRVPGNVTFANNKLISVTNDITSLEDTYRGYLAQLEEAFYPLFIEGPGYPWGITTPLTYNSYDEISVLAPDTIPGEGVQINLTFIAHNVQLAYQAWQTALADTKITVQAGPSNWVFAADKSLRLPNSAIIRQSTHEDVTTAYELYVGAIANWEMSRLSDYLATVNAGLVTLEGHPFAGWADVSGTTAQAYLDIVTNAWVVQHNPSSPPTPLVFVPAISSDLYQQLRTQLQSVITKYNTWQALAQSVDIVAGAETLSILGNNKIQVPGIIQTDAEEDITIRTRYAVASSPVGSTTYDNQDFVFGTNGSLTMPSDGVVSTYGVNATHLNTSYLNYENNESIQVGHEGGGNFAVAMDRFQVLSKVPTSSKGSSGDVLGCIAFDANYIYYCSGLYNGTNDIWHRVVWTDNTW